MAYFWMSRKRNIPLHGLKNRKSIQMKKKFLNILLLVIAIALSIKVAAQSALYGSQSASSPKREVRAVWLTTIGGLDWPHSYAQSARSIEKQKTELRNLLDKLKQANINTVLMQTRIRGTVIYPSAIEPWDGCMSGRPGTSPGYDPLAFAIEECHKRGMELHAWIVSVPIGRANGAGVRNLKGKHPELVQKIGDEFFMRPEKDGTARYIADLCREIVRGYDVDGIHLDYIRYPEMQKLTISRQQARNNISNIVQQVSYAVKQEKPWVKMSCSPIGKRNDLSRFWSRGWNAEEKGCQDVGRWTREGWMDQLYPMMYFRGDQFFPFVADWQEQSHGRTVTAGLGIYFLSPKEANWPEEDVEREMFVCRNMGVGTAFFRNKFFVDNTKGIYSFTANEFNTYPALVPEMTWYSHPAPLAPCNLRVKTTGESTEIAWDESQGAWNGSRMVQGSAQNPVVFYNVYGSDTWPVDVNDARNIIAQRVKGSRFTMPKSAIFSHFAVTAVDRFGKESAALTMDSPSGEAAPLCATLLRNDGNTLQMPEKPQGLDADFIVFETATGVSYATKPYARTINVANIPGGVYQLRSLSAKGKTHRIGWAYIKK